MTGKLKARRESLDALWKQGQSGRSLLLEHTQLIDECLVACFTGSPHARNMSLIALGGYGRKELFPFSDIDLLLLYDTDEQESLDRVAEAIFYPLWDAGLEVGHSVRTLSACLKDAEEDFFFQVALLDARLLAGSEEFFETLMKAYGSKFVEGNRNFFLKNMEEHRSIRQSRFGMHSYMLEPHIKESRGGLRDIQAMLWAANVFFGLKDLAGMHEAGLLNSAEHEKFEGAWDHLVRIRNRLHYISGRKNDQLFFDHQEAMAAALGYRNGGDMLGVERFMRDVHESMQHVAVTTDQFFEHVDDVIAKPRYAGESSFCQTLEAGIEVRAGRVYLQDLPLLRQKPYLLMRIFEHAAKLSLSVHHRTSRFIRENLQLVDEKLQKSRRMAKSFLEILMHAKPETKVLEAMLESGLLSAYIPEFAGLESLTLHDVYHIYTVDRHVLQTVYEIQALTDREKTVYEAIEKRPLLYLAALLHDIGKGYGKAHSERGAERAKEIGARLGLDASEQELLSFLILHHLFLIDTALRRDLEDEELILRCAGKINTPERLNMLYLLSIADARSTGPSAWNEWKAALLLELFLRISLLLERSDLDDSAPDQSQAIVWMQDQVKRLQGTNPLVDVKELPSDYLLSFTPEDVLHHIQLRGRLAGQTVILKAEKRTGHWPITLVTKDRSGLLAKICGVLALHNLRVLAARIFTWDDGTVVDALDVYTAIESTYEDQDWHALEEDLYLAINSRLGLEYRLSGKPAYSGRTSATGTQRLEAAVRIDNSASERFTVVEIFAEDRPGLLYDIAKTISDFNLYIFRARIGTKADQVVDVFYVRDQDGRKLVDESFLEELRKSLLHAATHVSARI